MSLYKRGDSPYWWMILSAPGRRRRRVSTRIPIDAPSKEQRAELKRQAETIYAKAQAAFALEVSGAGPKKSITVAELLDWYLEHVTPEHKGEERERSIVKRLRAELGSFPLSELTRDRIIEWRTARGRQVAPATVNREVDVLKAACNTAVPTYLEKSPVRGIKRLKFRSATIHVLSREDEQKLLAVLPPADRAIIICALDTLMRAGDILRLRWVDDHGTHLHVRDPKTGFPYDVPVSTRLRAALTALPKKGEYVFGHRRAGNGRSIELWRMLRDACLRAGVQEGRKLGITFHALRHTGATRLAAAGVDLVTIMALGGWRSLTQLARYAHPTQPHLVQAVNLIGPSPDTSLSRRPDSAA